MPAITGKLVFLVASTDYDSLPGRSGRSSQENFEVEAHPQLFDHTYLRDVTSKNAHNLPVDPVSIAIAAAMGLNWNEIVCSCAAGDDGISLVFRKDEGGDRIVLPASHPVNDKVRGREEEFIRCGNQSISILIDEEMHWQCYRGWPDNGGNYTDKGTLDVPMEYVPASTLAAYENQIEKGTLTLDRILAWKDADIPKAKVLKIEKSDSHVTFYFEFPAGQGGRSRLA